jgi:hypothetical protein
VRAPFLALSLLLLAAPAALAAEQVSGDGFRAQLPEGFKGGPGSQLAALEQQAQNTFGSYCFVKGKPTTHLYLKGDVDSPESVLLLASIELESGRAAGTVEELRDMDGALSAVQAQFESVGLRLETRERRVGGHRAIEMRVEGTGSLVSDGFAGVRVAYVPLGSRVFVVMLLGAGVSVARLEGDWDAVLGGLHLEAGGLAISPGTIAAVLGVLALVAFFFLGKGAASGKLRAAREALEVASYKPPEAVRGKALEDDPLFEGTAVGAGARVAPEGLKPTWSPEASRRHQENLAKAAQKRLPSGGQGLAGLRPTLPPSGRWSDRAAPPGR